MFILKEVLLKMREMVLFGIDIPLPFEGFCTHEL